MIVDKLMEAAERKGREDRGSGRIFASSVGGCVLKLWFGVHGATAEPLPARSLMVFDLGNRVEDAVGHWIIEAEIPHVRTSEERDKVFMPELGSNVRPDFFAEPEINGNRQVIPVEVKSMSDFAFERAEAGKLDEQYLAQAECYMRAYGTDYVLFVLYRKETSHLHEILVPRSDSRWAEIIAKVEVARGDERPARPYELEVKCDGCDGTGKTPKRGQPHKACSGTGELPGGPYIPVFPCGFCRYKKPCWGPMKIAFLNGKPRWRLCSDAEVDDEGGVLASSRQDAGVGPCGRVLALDGVQDS